MHPRHKQLLSELRVTSFYDVNERERRGRDKTIRQSKTLDKKRQDMTRQIHQTTQDIKAKNPVRVRVRLTLKVSVRVKVRVRMKARVRV
jgi:hypothetical protein